MRLDQFLQKSGIIKRRGLAKEFCDRGAVELSGRKVKPAHEVSPGDELTVRFHDRRCFYRITQIPLGNLRKEDRGKYVELVREELFHEEKLT